MQLTRVDHCWRTPPGWTPEAPAATPVRSTTVTDAPCWSRCHAIERPVTPAPTTITSGRPAESVITANIRAGPTHGIARNASHRRLRERRRLLARGAERRVHRRQRYGCDRRRGARALARRCRWPDGRGVRTRAG